MLSTLREKLRLLPDTILFYARMRAKLVIKYTIFRI